MPLPFLGLSAVGASRACAVHALRGSGAEARARSANFGATGSPCRKVKVAGRLQPVVQSEFSKNGSFQSAARGAIDVRFVSPQLRSIALHVSTSLHRGGYSLLHAESQRASIAASLLEYTAGACQSAMAYLVRYKTLSLVRRETQ